METSTGKSFDATLERTNSFGYPFPSACQRNICRKLFETEREQARGKAAESQNAQQNNENVI